MTLVQWFVFFLVVQIVHFAGTWKLYQKAGRQAWEAAIPIYNAIILMKIINRPSWWTILLFVPIVNLIMFPVIWVETIRSFGKNSRLDTLLVLVTLGFYVYYINYTQNVTHIKDRSLVSTSKTGDTVSSFLFAIVVATVVHTYVMQPFTIPTSSLEKSLLVGDFLFVSKFHYGARVPMTTVAAPMVHDTLPFFKTKSYLSWPQLPYFRFPGFEKVEKNDIVVFNWPVDTVYRFFDYSGRKGVIKPIDKKSNYVKRCVGTPGDNLSIKNGDVYINNKKLILPERAKPQYSYIVTTDGNGFDLDYLFKELKITDPIYPYGNVPNTFIFSALTDESASRLKNTSNVKSIVKNLSTAAEEKVFPFNTPWNKDNFGPIYIPQEGATVAINSKNIAQYSRIINVYEKNDLQVNGNEIRINGKVATNYTFKQNYYWMMGDNRHNSEDSRYWGYVPEDHIVGKPVFIWMSVDGINGPKRDWSVRWERVFTTVGGEGQPYSYFKFFLIAVAAYIGISFFLSRRKEQAEK